MSRNWLRRALLATACLSSLLVSACGSGSIESQFNPSRIVVFGDGFSDMGQAGGSYTVNDGAVDTWAGQVAASYGVPLTAARFGGTAYAVGNARITVKPDAAGKTSTPTVKEQIDSFLATGTVGTGDLFIVSGGISDILAEDAKVRAGTQTADQMLANVAQAGKDLGAQVHRIVAAGSHRVAVVGSYNLARSPFARISGQTDLLLAASSKFNEALLVSIVDLGSDALYIDAAFYYNLAQATPASYTLNDATNYVCTTVDPGPGIGIGPNEVNSSLCNQNTVSGTAYLTYLFADKIYFTPQGNRLFGDYAYTRLRARF